jgi:hypothetical protein
MTIGPMNAGAVRSVLSGFLNERWSGIYENGRGAFMVPGMGRTACFVEPTDLRTVARGSTSAPRSCSAFHRLPDSSNSWP